MKKIYLVEKKDFWIPSFTALLFGRGRFALAIGVFGAGKHNLKTKEEVKNS
jgi:hypothetical protein